MKRLELIGKTFNDWKVIEYIGKGKWLCKCTCGVERGVSGSQLVNNKSKSCGHNTTGFKDIKNKVFGEWKALSYSGNSYWKCECSCGTIKDVSIFHLKSGGSKSCGHGLSGFAATNFKTRQETSNIRHDIKIGDTINEWKIIEFIGNSKCKCLCSCGKIQEVSKWNIRSGRSKSCGHNKLKDITGQQFNDWKVESYAGDSSWNCKCSCGKVAIIRSTDLLSGNSKSCGHNRTNTKRDIINRKFDSLTVIEYNGNGIYTCKCDCNNIKEIRGSNLLNGGTTSCGCKQESKYTKEYLTILINNYTVILGRKPFIKDIQEVTELNIGYISRLIKENGLEQMLDKSYRSKMEIEIYDYIASLIDNKQIEICNRTVLKKFELDIYISSLRIAIEFNGNYWHSDLKKNIRYHQKKTIACAKQGIQLIHIFEYEWNDLNIQIKLKDMIADIILSNDRLIIYDSECEVRLIESNMDEKVFLQENSLNGYKHSDKAYGLYDNTNRLISIMTFKSLGNSECTEWELVSYCTIPNINNGGKKLLDTFIENNNPKSILVYVEISKFTGEEYTKLGFKATKSDMTIPNYVWVDYRYKDKQIVINRHDGYTSENKSETETKIMRDRGFIRIYDSGRLKFTWYKDIK